MKFFFVDLETTGTDHTKHGVWQIAAEVVIDGKMIDRFEAKFRPLKGKMVASDALERCGVTMEQLRSFGPAADAFRELKAVLGRHVDKYDKKDKFFFIGYNGQFDNQFLRRWFEDLGDQYFGSWFWYPYLDVAQMAGFCLMRRRAELPNFRLETVAEHFGVELENAHDAGADIAATRRIFEILVDNGMRVFDEVTK